MTQTWTSRLLELFLTYIHGFSGIDRLAVIIILIIGNTARLIKSSNKYLSHCGSNTPRAPAHQLNLTIRGYPLAVALGLHDIILHISVVVEDLIIYRSRTPTDKDALGWVARQDRNVSRSPSSQDKPKPLHLRRKSVSPASSTSSGRTSQSIDSSCDQRTRGSRE